MARRQYPVAQVDYRERGYRYQIDEFAWSWWAPAERMSKLAGLESSWQTVADMGVIGDPTQYLPTVVFDKERKLIALQRFWSATRTWSADATALWTASPSSVTLEADTIPEVVQEGVRCFDACALTSTFEVCRDGWWSAWLWRPKLEDDDELGSEALQSSITWGQDGNTGYSIVWPRGKESPYLAFYANGQWWKGDDLSLQTDHEDGEMIAVSAGILWGHVVVFDIRGQKANYFQRETTSYSTKAYETAPQAPLVAANLHNQWAFTWCPDVMFTSDVGGTVDVPRSLPVNPDFGARLGGYGADADGITTPETTLFDWDAEDDDPDWTGLTAGEIGLAMRRNPTNYYQAEWRVRMMPYTLADTGAGVTVTTYATPGLGGLAMWQGADLTDLGAPSVETDLTDTGLVKELSIEEPEDFGSSQMTLVLDNMHGESKDIEDFRAVTLTYTGWARKNDTATTVPVYDTLWTMEPTLAGAEARVACLDVLALLGIWRFDDAPPFDGWTVENAIAWILNAHGLGTAFQDLEDLYDTDYSATVGLLVPGPWDEPAWQPQRGTSPLAFIQEIAAKGSKGATVWQENGVVKTGCRFCGAKRTAATWPSHQDNGWLSSGCLAVDQARAGNADGVDVECLVYPDDTEDPDTDAVVTELTRAGTRLDPYRYANYVSAYGRGELGEAYSWVAQDATAIAALNMIIPRHETDYELSSSALVAGRATDLLNELSHDPTYVRGTALFHPWIRRGYVLRFHCDTVDRMDLNNTTWRVTAVAQTIRRDGPYTRFEARKLS